MKRAIKEGFNCFTTRIFIGVCPVNQGIPKWCDPKVPFKKRWKDFNSPLGLNIKEYRIYKKIFWSRTWILHVFKAYLKFLLPRFYSWGKRVIN